MLYTIAVILVILWLLGLVTSYTMGGFIHLLLVIAIIAAVLGFGGIAGAAVPESHVPTEARHRRPRGSAHPPYANQ